jgi:hypothetical protein
MTRAGVGVLAKVCRRQVGKPVANSLPLLHVRRITSGAADTAVIGVSLFDLVGQTSILRAGCNRNKGKQGHCYGKGFENTFHSASRQVLQLSALFD